jgi:hypothetical protein
MILLRIFCEIVRVRDRSNRNMTVLQNHFLVNLHDWMTDSQIDMAHCSNRAAERDSVSDAKMSVNDRFAPQAAPQHGRPRGIDEIS